MKTTFYQCLHGANFHAYIPFVCSLLSFYCCAHIFAFTRSEQQSEPNRTELRPNRTAANQAHGMSTRWPRRVHLAPTVVVIVVVVVLVVGVLSKFSTLLLLLRCLLCSVQLCNQYRERPTRERNNNNKKKHRQLAAARAFGGEGARQGVGIRGPYVVCVGLTK